ncbi:hypothetical protein G9A89_007634 [Geosiphon pyriformis]|nr:hypothetical protein G9A89_007634 [Geosiphon pyriformis]
MDLKAVFGSNMSKKKTPKGVFYVVLGNVKHSGNKKNISLSKSSSGNSVYSNIDSLSGNDEDIGITGVNSESYPDLAVTTSKAKCVNTDIGFGSSLSSSNFYMEDNKVVLSSRLPIFLKKKWIDPKIIKTPVEVSVRKLFALDINLLVVKDKSVTAKTQVIRKNFSSVNSFGEATIPSKFEGIIRYIFTSVKSIEMATLLAKEKEININSNLKRQGVRLDWAVVIKKIPMNTPKEMIVAALAEFGKIKLIKIQLIGLWQKAVVKFAELD